MNNRKKKKFRLNKKGFFLTFPKCSVPKETAMKNLKESLIMKSKIPIQWAMISQEKHKDGTDHLHVLIWYEREINIKTETFFDCLTNQHANVQPMGNVQKSIQYLQKEDSAPLVLGNLPSVNSDSKRSKKTDEIASLVLGGKTFDDILTDYPGFAMMNKRKIQELQNHIENTKSQSTTASWSFIRYDGKDENSKIIVEWINRNVCRPRKHKQKQLYIHGPPDHNKTSLAMFLHSRARIYWCAQDAYFDGYSDKGFDLVIMDEFIPKFDIQNRLNAFLDGSLTNLVVRYGNILKAKNLPTIILSNYSLDLQYSKKESCLAQMRARCTEVWLHQPIDLKNMVFDENLNIQFPDENLIVID